jgi:anti-anti-sigma factor
MVEGPVGPVFSLAGEIDMSNSQAIRDKILTVAAAGPAVGTYPSVVVDLSKLRFIDSSAVSALIQLASQLGDTGRQLVLVAARDCVATRTLRLVGLDEAMRLQEPSLDLGCARDPDHLGGVGHSG